MLKIFFAFVFAAISTFSSAAKLQDFRSSIVTSSKSIEWEQFGPGMSGYCEYAWTHPTDPKVLFLGPDMHVSYGSWDGSESYQSIKPYDGNNFELGRMRSMAFSASDPDFGLAMPWDGWIYESHDRGRSWSKISDMAGRCNVVAIDPNDAKRCYVGAGDYWSVKDNQRTLALPHGKINEREGYGYIERKSLYGFIAKSTDGGRSWKKVSKGLPAELDVIQIMVDPRNSKHIVAATSHGIFRSEDSGESWNKEGKGIPNNLPRDMSQHYDKKSKVWTLFAIAQTWFKPDGESLSYDGGVFKSTDGGRTWCDITGNLAIDLNKISYNKTGGWNTLRSFYYKTIGHWFGITPKEAEAKYPKYPEKIISVFNRIVVNPTNVNKLMISHNMKHDRAFPPSDVWVSSDCGKSWQPSTRYGLYWSTTAGTIDKEYWDSRSSATNINMEFGHMGADLGRKPEYQGNRFLSVSSAGDVYICTDQQVLRSQDWGKTWQQRDDYELIKGSGEWIGRGNSDLPGRFIMTNTGVDGRYLLCSGEHGLWQISDPYGKKVAVRQLEGQVNAGGAHSISYVTVDPRNPDIISTISWRQDHLDKFRRSTDGGKSWSNVSNLYKDNESLRGVDLKKVNGYQYSLVTDPTAPDNIYFCTVRNAFFSVGSPLINHTHSGVYKSSDDGKTWKITNSGLPKDGSVNKIVIDPKTPKRIYATLNAVKNIPGGLYLSTDKCESWSEVKIPSVIKDVNDLSICPSTGAMYISCGSRGGTWEQGGVWQSKDQGKSWTKIFEMPTIWRCSVSPINPDILILSSARQKNANGVKYLDNPGVYISHNGGMSWEKVNRGIAQVGEISNVECDPKDERYFWISAWGCGWYRGVYKGSF